MQLKDSRKCFTLRVERGQTQCKFPSFGHSMSELEVKIKPMNTSQEWSQFSRKDSRINTRGRTSLFVTGRSLLRRKLWRQRRRRTHSCLSMWHTRTVKPFSWRKYPLGFRQVVVGLCHSSRWDRLSFNSFWWVKCSALSEVTIYIYLQTNCGSK